MAPALELILTRSAGQPWLVNALCREACFETGAGRDRSRAITAADIVDAQERLILARVTHLDQLADKLREERVRRVIGRGRVDLLILWPQGGRTRKFVVECKVLHKDAERTIADGLAQTRGYMDRCGAEAGHLIVFDRAAGRTWEEKLFRHEAPAGPGAAPITVWGM